MIEKLVQILNQLISIKKFFLIIIYFFIFNNLQAAPGIGELVLSDKVINNFQIYLQGKQGKPVKFLVTEDGKDSWGWYCPHSQCVPTGSMNEEALCERKFSKKCFTFAIGKSIRWKNEKIKNAKAPEKRFSSKDSLIDIKNKLASLNFYNNGLNTQVISNSSSIRVGKRALAMNWVGYKNLIVGEIEFKEKNNVGSLKLQLPNNDGKCEGTYALSTTLGTWSLLCSNKMSASGNLVLNSTDGSVTGEGKDTKGNKVEFTVQAE